MKCSVFVPRQFVFRLGAGTFGLGQKAAELKRWRVSSLDFSGHEQKGMVLRNKTKDDLVRS